VNRAGSGRGPARGVALRVLLSLLLIALPLLSAGPMAGTGTADTPVEHAMPCHDGPAAGGAAPDRPDCPHCTDPARAAMCDCCDQAAPSAAAKSEVITYSLHYPATVQRAVASVAVPTGPNDQPYRPPIQTA